MVLQNLMLTFCAAVFSSFCHCWSCSSRCIWTVLLPPACSTFSSLKSLSSNTMAGCHHHCFNMLMGGVCTLSWNATYYVSLLREEYVLQLEENCLD